LQNKILGLVGLQFMLLLLVNVSSGQGQDSAKVSHDYEIKIEAEYRYFYQEPQFPEQKDHFPSISIEPSYTLEWRDGYERIDFTGFVRLDVDDHRTHWDIRELYYQKVRKNWELSIGAKKIFWGVTESLHLVDIINQTDQVESFDGEQKLGQPMVQLSWVTSKAGTFDLFYLPYHRRRTFGGEKSRVRFAQVFEKGDIDYESNAEEWHQSFAVRWSHYFGILDIGVSHFYGNGREPYFDIGPMGFTAYYPVINQTGLDFQITHSAFLWKFESIYRTSDAEDFIALAVGLEYTFGNINRKGLDIGLLSEYLYDERGDLSQTGLQNDIFVGSRLGFNDERNSSILFGMIFDLESTTKIYSVEAARRIANSLTAEIELRILSDVDDGELFLSSFKKDSFLRFTLAYFF